MDRLFTKRLGYRGKSCLAVSVLMAFLILFYAGAALGSSEGGGSKGWVETDSLRVMNFVVLAVALFVVLRKPVSQALNGRIKDIQDQLNDLESKKKDAEKKLAEYNEKIATLGQEAEEIVAQYIKQGEEAKERILKEAETAAEKLEDQAQRTIENEFKNAKNKLQTEILEKALKKAEELVKSKITSEDQDRLVDEYLDKVVA